MGNVCLDRFNFVRQFHQDVLFRTQRKLAVALFSRQIFSGVGAGLNFGVERIQVGS